MPHDSSHCQEVFALLSQYLDLELPPQDCEELQKHIEACPPCVEFAESLRKSVELCRQHQASAAPPALSPERRKDLEQAWSQALQRLKSTC